MQLFKCALALGVFLELTGPNSPLFNLAHAEGIHASAHTHARTHARTHTRTHTRTHART